MSYVDCANLRNNISSIYSSSKLKCFNNLQYKLFLCSKKLLRRLNRYLAFLTVTLCTLSELKCKKCISICGRSLEYD